MEAVTSSESMTKSLRTIFMGTPSFAVPTLEMLAAQTNLQLVVTQPDRKRGRGKKLEFSPVKSRALELGCEIIGPSVVKGKRFAAQMAAYQPDVIVTAAFGRILGASLLETPKYGCLNVHASILPKYRGAAPINWAIINGESQTGVSIMKTVPQLDAGDVLRVATIPIERQTAGELTDELARLGAAALLETLQHIEQIVPTPQREEDATFAPMMTKDDGKLNWVKSAAMLDCQVRGMHPWPGAFTFWQGEPLKIHGAAVVSGAASAGEAPGTVLAQTVDGVHVACGEGVLRLTEIQLPGKKRLHANQFYAGIKFAMGTQFQ